MKRLLLLLGIFPLLLQPAFGQTSPAVTTAEFDAENELIISALDSLPI